MAPVNQGAKATPLLIASNVSLASPCVALTWAYQKDPPTFDWLAAYVNSCETGRLVAPPNALLVFSKLPEHVAVPLVLSIILQILVRSIVTPPMGAGALILFPPSTGLLK